MTKKPTKPRAPQAQSSCKKIPQEVHEEALRVARNLMKLPPKPNSKVR